MPKIIDQSFAPMVVNTPPIDSRFIYRTVKDFKDATPFHYEGCISYIKDSDTYIQIGENGYCQVLTCRVGVMDILEFANFTVQEYIASNLSSGVSVIDEVLKGNLKISISSGNYEDGYTSYADSQELKNLVFFKKYMRDYDIILDPTNNIFVYKYVKNIHSNDKYTLDDLFIKFAVLDQNDSDIYSKIRSTFEKAYNNLQSVNDFGELKSNLSTVFSELKELRRDTSVTNSQKHKKYNDFKYEKLSLLVSNDNNSESSSNNSNGRIVVNHEDHL